MLGWSVQSIKKHILKTQIFLKKKLQRNQDPIVDNLFLSQQNQDFIVMLIRYTTESWFPYVNGGAKRYNNWITISFLHLGWKKNTMESWFHWTHIQWNRDSVVIWEVRKPFCNEITILLHILFNTILISCKWYFWNKKILNPLIGAKSNKSGANCNSLK